MKLTAVVAEEFHGYQFYTKLYPVLKFKSIPRLTSCVLSVWMST